MDELQISGKRFISSRRIAKDNGYTADYVGQLIRAGKVIGQKVGRAWYVDAVSFEQYLGSETKSAVMEPPVVVEEKIVIPEKIEPVEEKEIKSEPKPESKKEGVTKEPVTVAGVIAEEVKEKEVETSVPLRVFRKEVSAPKSNLQYYSDDAPLLPRVASTQKEFIPVIAEEIVEDDAPTRSYSLGGLVVAAVVIFAASAFVLSGLTLDLSSRAGESASAAYSFGW